MPSGSTPMLSDGSSDESAGARTLSDRSAGRGAAPAAGALMPRATGSSAAQIAAATNGVMLRRGISVRLGRPVEQDVDVVRHLLVVPGVHENPLLIEEKEGLVARLPRLVECVVDVVRRRLVHSSSVGRGQAPVR